MDNNLKKSFINRTILTCISNDVFAIIYKRIDNIYYSLPRNRPLDQKEVKNETIRDYVYLKVNFG